MTIQDLKNSILQRAMQGKLVGQKADSNLYASKYELYLPDKKELQEKSKEWIAEETGGEKP